MLLERLEVSCCRNLSALALDLLPGLNLFLGPNGAGKTSILEAVHVLARGRSFRSSRIDPVIQQGAEAMLLRAALRDERRGSLSIGMQRRRSAQTELRINGESERRLSEVARLIPIQLILPDSGALVSGEPAQRRRFLDWGAFHVEPSYVGLLRRYQRALRQRNRILREARGKREQLSPEIESWNEALAERGEHVAMIRRDYVQALAEHFPPTLTALAPELEVELQLGRGWPEGEPLANSLSKSLPPDVKLGVTQQGPHRAELRLLVAGAPAAATLSRGQTKMVAMALHLAQSRLTTEATGRGSIFLIDDLGAELDRDHSQRFFRVLGETECQVLATATTAPELGNVFERHGRRMFHVEHGACRIAEDIGSTQDSGRPLHGAEGAQ